MRKYGLVPLMARLLKSIHFDVVVNMMSTCQLCATQVRWISEYYCNLYSTYIHVFTQPSYQLAITTEGMIPDIVSHLSSDDLELKMQCSRAIFKCANDKVYSVSFNFYVLNY